MRGGEWDRALTARRAADRYETATHTARRRYRLVLLDGAAPVRDIARMDLLRWRPLLYLLILLNSVVLLGQLWPAGAPPFARAVNIGFLALSLLTLAARARDRP